MQGFRFTKNIHLLDCFEFKLKHQMRQILHGLRFLLQMLYAPCFCLVGTVSSY